MESTLTFESSQIRDSSLLYLLDTENFTFRTFGLLESPKRTPTATELAVRVALPPPEDRNQEVTCGGYEGGFTIWESTWVLLAFLDTLEGKQGLPALELGSGLGVCGTLLSLKGFKVTFQDLNLSVIHKALIPNLLLNHALLDGGDQDGPLHVDLHTVHRDDSRNTFEMRTEVVKYSGKTLNFQFDFLAGDWRDLVETRRNSGRPQGKFDLLIASECTYRTENYQSFVEALSCFLKESGKAYIATKRFYFGMTGGTFQFLNFLEEFRDSDNYRLVGKIALSAEPKNSSNVIDLIEITKELLKNQNN